MFDSSSGTLKLSKIEAGLDYLLLLPCKLLIKRVQSTQISLRATTINNHIIILRNLNKHTLWLKMIYPLQALYCFQVLPACFFHDRDRDHVYQPKKGGHVPFAVWGGDPFIWTIRVLNPATRTSPLSPLFCNCPGWEQTSSHSWLVKCVSFHTPRAASKSRRRRIRGTVGTGGRGSPKLVKAKVCSTGCPGFAQRGRSAMGPNRGQATKHHFHHFHHLFQYWKSGNYIKLHYWRLRQWLECIFAVLFSLFNLRWSDLLA